MKSLKRKIQAASDYRTFYGYDLDEVEELFPDVFYDYFYDVQDEVQRVFISDNPDCEFIGAQDSDGGYFIYKSEDPDFGPGWFEVDFAEFDNYLK